MNLRLYSVALLVSALPIFALAESHGVKLGASDFISAEKNLKNGEIIVSLKLSKSGRSKFKKLKAQTPTHRLLADLATTGADLELERTDSGIAANAAIVLNER